MSKVLIDSHQVGQQSKMLNIDGSECGKFSFEEYEKFRGKIWAVCAEYEMGMSFQSFDVAPQPFNQKYLERKKWIPIAGTALKHPWGWCIIYFKLEDTIVIETCMEEGQQTEYTKVFEGPCKTVDNFEGICKYLNIYLP